MPLPSEQHQNTTSEYTPCKTDTRRGMIKHMHGCLSKALPDRSLFNMSDYIIQHQPMLEFAALINDAPIVASNLPTMGIEWLTWL